MTRPPEGAQRSAADPFGRAELCCGVFTKHCGRPELSGKTGSFAAFQSLSEDAIVDIAVKFIQEELDNYCMKLAKVDEALMADILRCLTGHDTRAIRELVRGAVGQRLLKEEDPEAFHGQFVALAGTLNDLEIEVPEGEF